MDRAARLRILVTSIRASVTRVVLVLEEVNAGLKERTHPRALERAFRSIEHDADVLDLPRLSEFAGHAKDVAAALWDLGPASGAAELLNEAAAELGAAADALEKGERHGLRPDLVERLGQAARNARETARKGERIG